MKAIDGQLRLAAKTEVERSADKALASFTTYTILDSLIRRHKALAVTNPTCKEKHLRTAQLIEIAYERISAMLVASSD